MAKPHKLLVVDSNADNGMLLVRSLTRKYPRALIELCRDPATAVQCLSSETIDCVVLHRTDEVDAVTLIKEFLAVAPSLPILAVSGFNRRKLLIDAGAADFLDYDEWLRVGNVVDAMLDRRPQSAAPFRGPNKSV